MSLPPFQAVHDAHRDVVWRFVVGLVGRADADDVVQETWLAALRGYPELRDPAAALSWLLTIASRACTDEHRARDRRPTPVDDSVDEPAAGTDDPRDDALWAQVRTLPPKQRLAVAHRFIADRSYAEVGAAMGTTAAAARRNVHEAITTLRTTWRP